jgi:hypothetical protein
MAFSIPMLGADRVSRYGEGHPRRMAAMPSDLILNVLAA